MRNAVSGRMKGGSRKAIAPRMWAKVEFILYFCATERSSMIFSVVGGRSGDTGRIKLRRLERMSPVSDIWTDGSPPEREEVDESDESIVDDRIKSPSTGELLVI